MAKDELSDTHEHIYVTPTSTDMCDNIYISTHNGFPAHYYAHFQNLPPLRKNEFEWRVPNFLELRNDQDAYEEVMSPPYVLQDGVSICQFKLFPKGPKHMKYKTVGLFLVLKKKTRRYIFRNTQFHLAVINFADWRKTKCENDTFTFTHKDRDRGWHEFLSSEHATNEFWSPSGEMIIRGVVGNTASNTNCDTSRDELCVDDTASDTSTDMCNNIYSSTHTDFPAYHYAHFQNLPPLREGEFEWRLPNFLGLRNKHDSCENVLSPPYMSPSYVIENNVSSFKFKLFPKGTKHTNGKAVGLFVLIYKNCRRWALHDTQFHLSIVNFYDWRKTMFGCDTFTFTHKHRDRGWHEFIEFQQVETNEFWSPSGEMIIRGCVRLQNNNNTNRPKCPAEVIHTPPTQERYITLNLLEEKDELIARHEETIQLQTREIQKYKNRVSDLKRSVDTAMNECEAHEEETVTCKICCVRKIETSFMPCGHAVACKGCSTDIYRTTKKCPICNKESVEVVNIFL